MAEYYLELVKTKPYNIMDTNKKIVRCTKYFTFFCCCVLIYNSCFLFFFNDPAPNNLLYTYNSVWYYNAPEMANEFMVLKNL